MSEESTNIHSQLPKFSVTGLVAYPEGVRRRYSRFDAQTMCRN